MGKTLIHIAGDFEKVDFMTTITYYRQLLSYAGAGLLLIIP